MALRCAATPGPDTVRGVPDRRDSPELRFHDRGLMSDQGDSAPNSAGRNTENTEGATEATETSVPGQTYFTSVPLCLKNIGFQCAFIDRRAEAVRMKSCHPTAETPNF